MYEIIPDSFNSILLNSEDLLQQSSSIIFDFFKELDYSRFYFFRYFKFNDNYCAYELIYNNKPNSLFLFFPGSESNIKINSNVINWRNKDHYLNSRNFINRGLKNNNKNFIQSSTQINNVTKLYICGFSLGSVVASLYLGETLKYIDYYNNLNNIFVEIYSPTCLPENERKLLCEQINSFCKDKNIKLTLRYHIAEGDIVPLNGNCFLFDQTLEQLDNVNHIMYYYKFSDKQSSYKKHFYIDVKHINLGFIDKVIVFENQNEINKFWNNFEYCDYKNQINFFNFIFFLYKYFGNNIGTHSYHNFSYIVNMYYYMISDILDFYNFNKLTPNNNKNINKFVLSLMKLMENMYSKYEYLYYINYNLIQYSWICCTFVFNIIYGFLVLICNLYCLVLVLLKDYMRQIIELDNNYINL